MSYIKIKLGGEERGLKFTKATIIDIANSVGVSGSDGMALYSIIWCALRINLFVKDQWDEFSVTHSFEKVCEWIDEADEADLEKVLEVYKSVANSSKKAASEEGVEDEDKKKLPPVNTETGATNSPSAA